RRLERGTFLYEMTAHEFEMAALRIDRGLVVQRPVFEAKHQTSRHTIAARELDEIAVRHMSSIQRAQSKKTVDDAFRMTHGDGLGEQRARPGDGASDACRHESEPNMSPLGVMHRRRSDASLALMQASR